MSMYGNKNPHQKEKRFLLKIKTNKQSKKSKNQNVIDKKASKKMRNFIKIKIASPQKILSWTERPLPNGELIGEIKRPMKFKTIKIKFISNYNSTVKT